MRREGWENPSKLFHSVVFFIAQGRAMAPPVPHPALRIRPHLNGSVEPVFPRESRLSRPGRSSPVSEVFNPVDLSRRRGGEGSEMMSELLINNASLRNCGSLSHCFSLLGSPFAIQHNKIAKQRVNGLTGRCQLQKNVVLASGA